MSDIFVASLKNRIRAMNTLWTRAVSDMTLDHVNHHERPRRPADRLQPQSLH